MTHKQQVSSSLKSSPGVRQQAREQQDTCNKSARAAHNQVSVTHAFDGPFNYLCSSLQISGRTPNRSGVYHWRYWCYYVINQAQLEQYATVRGAALHGPPPPPPTISLAELAS